MVKFIIVLVIIGIVGIIWFLVKKDEKISKERRKNGIDKNLINSFLEEFGNDYYGYSYITGWNTYFEKKGRYVTTWKYLYIIPFDIRNDYFDLINVRFENDNIEFLGKERIFIKEEKIQCDSKKGIASVIIGDPKGRRKFIIEKIAEGCGKKDDSNPFALDQEREFNDFIKFIS